LIPIYFLHQILSTVAYSSFIDLGYTSDLALGVDNYIVAWFR
jgi:hypothetical protein